MINGGSHGNGEGEFYTPFDIAVDSNDDIYVLDTYNNRVQKFTSNGDFIKMWGSQGNGDGDGSGGFCGGSDGVIFLKIIYLFLFLLSK
ncbi:MAG: hypothetical protein ACM3VV_08060 [Deltaproteobacteria bacterium]